MADTKVLIKDANGISQPIDTRTTPDGDERQVVLLGDGENAGIIAPALDATLSAGIGGPGTTPPALPAGGSGLLGWLRSIYDLLRGTLTVGGAVSVSNLPATQPVSGTVSVGNLPATQPVSGTISIAPGSPTPFADAGTIASNTYRGITIKNTSATANAEVAVRNLNVTGTLLDTITLGPNESVRETYPAGRNVPAGTIYMQLVSGTVSGTVFA